MYQHHGSYGFGEFPQFLGTVMATSYKSLNFLAIDDENMVHEQPIQITIYLPSGNLT